MCKEVWNNCHPKLRTPRETLLEKSFCPFSKTWVPLNSECVNRLRTDLKPQPVQTPGKGCVLTSVPAGTAHLYAASTRLLRVFPAKAPFAGPGEAARRQGWKGLGEGAASAVFFGKPPNGPLFSNQEARTVCPPHQKSQVCLHVIFTTNGVDNCHNPKSTKAKGPSLFSGESGVGGGADSRGGVG